MAEQRTAAVAGDGQMYVAAIGIDRYREWDRLRNAVSDACGARDAFVNLGFKPVCEPLLDEAATHAALQGLVTDDLRRLGKNDSLILFFAGHGYTETDDFDDGHPMKWGYILPVDADRERRRTWLRLDVWLSEIARLPPRHILVILDACYSGVALDHAAILYRDGGASVDDGMERLRARRSRRIITSALDDQRAMDGGPRPGHSLFTGCLIEALTGSLAAQMKRPLATGSELGNYLQRRVSAYAKSQQTPGLGVLPRHDHGELILRLPGFDPEPERSKPLKETRGTRGKSKLHPKRRPGSRQDERVEPEVLDPELEPLDPDLEPDPPPDEDDDSAKLDPAFVAALDRHAAERARGASVLSVIAGDATVALAGWAEWAAGHGYLTLATEGASLDAAVADLLAQIPWLRCVASARVSLAAAADLDITEVDAKLDARSGRERRAWIEDVAGLDRDALVSGWLLSELREPRARVPDLSTAPAQGAELMAILCRLAAPIAVLVHHPEPTAPWLERAIPTAAALVTRLPDHAVAVGAPADLVVAVASGRPSAAFSMARQGVVPIAPRAEGSAVRTRGRAARVLHDALAHDRRTAGRFALDVEVPIHAGGPAIEVDLVAESERLAIEIDGWYHFRDPQGYRTARITDVRLQRAGYFVMRFLAEDVRRRLELIVDEIAVALRGRRASSA